MSVGDYYERYWSDEGYNPVRAIPGDLRAVLRDTLAGRGRCLDVGCGDGRAVGVWLSELVAEWVGVDVSERAVERARALGLDARRVDDAAELPFEDDSFDAAVCLDVLEHLFTPLDALREVARVLKPEGALVVTVPNQAYWRRRRELALHGLWNPRGDDRSVQEPWRDPHVRFFTREALRALVEAAGFADVRVGGHDSETAARRGEPTRRERLGRPLRARFPSLLALDLHAIASKPNTSRPA